MLLFQFNATSWRSKKIHIQQENPVFQFYNRKY